VNEKGAKEILNGKDYDPNDMSSNGWFRKAEGYLEGLVQGRKEGEARIIEKAKVLEEVLDKIHAMSIYEDKLLYHAVEIRTITKEAIAQWEKEK